MVRAIPSVSMLNRYDLGAPQCTAEPTVHPLLSARLFPSARRREGGALMAAVRESVTVAGRAAGAVARAFTAGDGIVRVEVTNRSGPGGAGAASR